MKKEDLIAKALQFRTYKLWEVIDDGMIFGVSLPDGEIGYCCVMGNGGQHYGIVLYKGNIGFLTYLNTVIPSQVPFEVFQTYNCLNCDFESSSDSNLSSSEKKLIREVAASRGIKICRPNGFPEFLRYDHGLIRAELTQIEMEEMAMILDAGIEVASALKGKSSLVDLAEYGFYDQPYPTHAGGNKIPLLAKQPDGSFEWSMTTTPKIEPKLFDTPEFNDKKMIEKLKAAQQKGSLHVKVMHLPSSIGGKEGRYFPLVILVMNDQGLLYPIMPISEYHHVEAEILAKLVNYMIDMEIYPSVILVDDDFSEAFLKDVCSKSAITLYQVDFLPELEEASSMLISRFS